VSDDNADELNDTSKQEISFSGTKRKGFSCSAPKRVFEQLNVPFH